MKKFFFIPILIMGSFAITNAQQVEKKSSEETVGNVSVSQSNDKLNQSNSQVEKVKATSNPVILESKSLEKKSPNKPLLTTTKL